MGKKILLFLLSAFFSLILSQKKYPVILSSDLFLYEQILLGFSSSFPQEVEVFYWDLITPKEFFAKRKNLPFIITIGERATRETLPYFSGEILFLGVSSPRELYLKSKQVCGVSLDVPIKKFFQVIKEIQPHAQKVATFYTTPSGEYLAEEGKYQDMEYALRYFPQKIQEKDFSSSLEKLLPLDAFLLLPDPLYTPSRFQKLSKWAKENHILLGTPFKELLRGAAFVIEPDYIEIGEKGANMAEMLLKGKKCKDLGVKKVERTYFYVNPKYAKESGISLPPSILQRAQTSRIYLASLQLFQEGEYNAAKKLLEKIIEKDPQNMAAKRLLNLVIGESTKKIVDLYMKKAQKKEEEKKYLEAALLYEKVLEINPYLEKARILQKEAYEKEKKRILEEGKKKEKKGEIFSALKLYTEAIETLPIDTTEIQKAIESLRKRERKRVPALLKKGQELYKKREYEKAAKIFENVLLLLPEDKTAEEYLDLSKKKYEALRRVIRKNRILR